MYVLIYVHQYLQQFHSDNQRLIKSLNILLSFLSFLLNHPILFSVRTAFMLLHTPLGQGIVSSQPLNIFYYSNNCEETMKACLKNWLQLLKSINDAFSLYSFTGKTSYSYIQISNLPMVCDTKKVVSKTCCFTLHYLMYIFIAPV